MKKYIAVVLLVLFPLVTSASSLTSSQVNSIILLLQAFGVSQATVNIVYGELTTTADTQLTPTTVATTTDTAVPQSFGSAPLPVNQPIMPEPLVCTLTAETDAVPVSINKVLLTWTSNADSATLSNDHIAEEPYSLPTLKPVTGGSGYFELSGEAGELNTFTAHFIGQGTTQDCTVSVMTE